MSMWRLPEGATFIGDQTHKHPDDAVGFGYYKLIRFETTGIYSLLGMAGEIRSCPQPWAKALMEGVTHESMAT